MVVVLVSIPEDVHLVESLAGDGAPEGLCVLDGSDLVRKSDNYSVWTLDFLRILTAAPELGPETGQPVSVTQTHLPGETLLTALRVSSTDFQKTFAAFSIALFWK